MSPLSRGVNRRRRDEDRSGAVDEKVGVLEEVLAKMDECARLLRHLGDERINAYCLAAFEGREGGWLGHFERDILAEAPEAARNGDDEEDNEDE